MSSVAQHSEANRSDWILRLPRAAWFALGVAALAASVAVGGPLMLALWIVPDLAMLAGLPRPLAADGTMNRRAIGAYNAAHYLYGPLALTLAGLVLPALLPFGLVWLSHVAIDRGAGYYPRDAEGNVRA